MSSADAPEVVVVGLGPVGITLCNLLASQGIRVEGVNAAYARDIKRAGFNIITWTLERAGPLAEGGARDDR